MTKLTALTETLTEKIDSINKKQDDELQHITAENTALSNQNFSPQESVAELNSKVAEMKWRSFRRDGQASSLLIGDGTIKHVTKCNVKDTDPICHNTDVPGMLDKIKRPKRRLRQHENRSGQL